MSEHWFRVLVTIPVALEPIPEDDQNVPPMLDARRLTDKARAAVARIPGRRDPEVREALAMLIDALEVLEDEVVGLRTRQDLAARQMSLNPMRMQLGGDGVTLFVASACPVGSRVRLHLALPNRHGGEGVHAVTGRVIGPGEGDRTVTEIAFDRSAPIEAVVAFCFDVQRRERRDQLDSLGSIG